MSAYSPKEYWSGVAENFKSADATGFAPVLHPGAPAWFNRLVDKLQFRAMRRALALAEIVPGARVLDVGCGTGRWLRRYDEMKLRATGVDATPGMLRVARDRGTGVPLAAGDAGSLPFTDAAFDCVSDVTVVQHMPSESQLNALREMVRVLKPGGALILMEVIRGEDSHVFSRSPQDWIGQVNSCGAKLVGWFGQEFLLVDRFFVGAVQRVIRTNKRRTRDEHFSDEVSAHPESITRRAYWRLRHVTASVAALTEPITQAICPAHLATHGVFVFRK